MFMADYPLARAMGLEVERVQMLNALEGGPLSYISLAQSAGIIPESALAHLDVMEKDGVVRGYMPKEPDASGTSYCTFEIVPEGLERAVGKLDRLLEGVR